MNPIPRKSTSKIAQRQLALRDQLWPGLAETSLWSRHASDGFTTIPRTLPVLMVIMDSLSKGKPVSSTYFDLWCRTFDDSFVVLNRPKEMAFNSGFSGQRAEQTWHERVRKLQALEFIDVKPGPSGPLSYALILNPYQIARKHHELNTPGMREDLYNALIARAAEIGAHDLMSVNSIAPRVEPPPPPPPPPPQLRSTRRGRIPST